MAGLLLASSILAPALSATPVAADPGTRLISSGGTATLASRPFGPEGGVQDPEFAREPDAGREAGGGEPEEVRLRGHSGTPLNGPTPTDVHVPGGNISNPGAGVIRSFDGLNHRQQRLANNGNQFSVEPPDQGLCVGNGFVVEALNDVFRVFDAAGNPKTSVIDLNTFLGYAAQIDRTTGLRGPFVTDPSCWFDAPTQRFFLTVLTLEVVPASGDFTGKNHLDLAVSRTADPTGAWNIFRVPVQDDGTDGTPDHGCPPGAATPPDGRTNPRACIGDFPHLGADANGLFVTTNEYCLFCPGVGFRAAQIYAFDKFALASGAATVAVTQIDTLGTQDRKPGFTLWPATSPTTADFEISARGTEYFTSSNAADEVAPGVNHSDQIIVWALSNTQSLRTASPALELRNTIVRVDEYSVPVPSNQKPGAFPLGQCVNDTTTPTPFGPGCWQFFFLPRNEPAHNEVEGKLDSSDSRVLSTTFVHGDLYGTLDTNVAVGGTTKAGVLFYIIRPHIDGRALAAELESQGHVAVPNNNVIYGTVAATHTRDAVIAFTLVGNDHFPTAAFVPLDRRNGLGEVTVITEGRGPQDGFTEYKAFVGDPPRPRWGDYGASVAADDNTIWVANEYIGQTCTLAEYMGTPVGFGFGSCGATRSSLGNWGTRISAIDVHHDRR